MCQTSQQIASNSGRCQRAGGIKLRAPLFYPTTCIHIIMLIRTNIGPPGEPLYQQIND